MPTTGAATGAAAAAAATAAACCHVFNIHRSVGLCPWCLALCIYHVPSASLPKTVHNLANLKVELLLLSTPRPASTSSLNTVNVSDPGDPLVFASFGLNDCFDTHLLTPSSVTLSLHFCRPAGSFEARHLASVWRLLQGRSLFRTSLHLKRS